MSKLAYYADGDGNDTTSITRHSDFNWLYPQYTTGYNVIDLRHPNPNWTPTSVSITDAVIPSTDLIVNQRINRGFMQVYDAVGTKINVYNDSLVKKTVFTVQDYVNSWNTTFLAHTNADVNTMSMTLTRYDNVEYDKITNVLDGYDNYQPGAVYRGPPTYFVIEFKSTAELYVRKFTSEKYLLSGFPYTSRATAKKWEGESYTHPVVGGPIIWPDSLHVTTRRFMVDTTKWSNSSIKIDSALTIFYNTLTNVTLANVTPYNEQGDLTYATDEKHISKMQHNPYKVELPPGVDKIAIKWVPTDETDDPDGIDNLMGSFILHNFTYKIEYKRNSTKV